MFEYSQNRVHAFYKKGFTRVMGDEQIEGKRFIEVNEIKFTGVNIDNAFNWKAQIVYTCTKIAKGIGVILKAWKVLHERISTLYYIFVYPYQNFCIRVLMQSLWYPFEWSPCMIACNITMLACSCINTPMTCFLKCLIIYFMKLMIHAYIVPVNRQQNIYMWLIFEMPQYIHCI